MRFAADVTEFAGRAHLSDRPPWHLGMHATS